MIAPVPAPIPAPAKPPIIAPCPFFLLTTAPVTAPTPAPITAPLAVELQPFFFVVVATAVQLVADVLPPLSEFQLFEIRFFALLPSCHFCLH